MKFAIAILALTASVASALACSDAELARRMRIADQWNRRAQVLAVLADNLRVSHFEAYAAERTAGRAAERLGVCLCEATPLPSINMFARPQSCLTELAAPHSS
jgi:hypothetical protein